MRSNIEYRQCCRCIMDNKSDNTIRFDDRGRCNYCIDIEKRLPYEYFPNEKGKEYLKNIFTKMKEECADDKYDCVVGVSGGIDSSYILYMGYKYGLRMLAIHIDDDLDNPIATDNLKKLIEKTGADYISIKPHHEEYADIIYSMLRASVSSLANAQDNLIAKALHDYCVENKIRYSLDGSNIAHEGILERGKRINASDKKYILSIHKKYGRVPLQETELASLWDRYLKRKNSGVIHIRPLNYINYDLESALKELNDFCGFTYYGGKHYESILTRFMQCYYLPVKFGIDKRKSHFSSLIMSGQLNREEASRRMEKPLYQSEVLLEEDKQILADYMKITVEELDELIALPPKEESSYPHSILNELAPLARKFRKILE